jgi:outer membrane receptor protein involved in Fe transport
MNPFKPGAAPVRLRFALSLFFAIVLFAGAAVGQSPNGTISGLVLDPSGRTIAGAEILIANDATGVKYSGTTNGEGIYAVPNLPPGPYRIQVSKIGFKTIIKPDVILNVQSAVALNFALPVGAVSETLTVSAGAPLVNTESATVSTVVDRQFAENLPLNGRSFQTLIDLSPGVVLTVSSGFDSGQFSINGQRAASNYWMVDGVSANIGVGTSGGNGLAGALGSFTAQGGTNSMVSVDAMQEFRIQTSTYAPEFGRTPGGQISIATRSGTNQFHGTLFEYLRNDVLDASNWFNGYTNNPPLPKAQERQNDFGGTIGGPIFRDRTFFFFSYEGSRLRLPQTSLSTVPDTNPLDPFSRQFALPSIQPFLNEYPLPNGPEVFASNGNHQGIAQFDRTYSNASSLDAYSLRLDHRLNGKGALFGRYNYSPSETSTRGGGGIALSVVSPTRITTQTATVGFTWALSSATANDLRFNYSRTSTETYSYVDSFGGASPLVSLPFPSPYGSANANFALDIETLTQGALTQGKGQTTVQRQINLVDALAIQKGSHRLKFGVDFRRLSPLLDVVSYGQDVSFLDVPSAANGNLYITSLTAGNGATLLFRNLGAFAQDTWQVTPRLTLTYGLRWDVDVAPSSVNGPSLVAVTGFDLNNLSGLALAPAGASIFHTRYGNVAPRLGVAYQLSQSQDWQTVVRGGFGVFFDLATQEVGNNIFGAQFPFGADSTTFGGKFPLTAAASAPPPVEPPNASNFGVLDAFDPNLKLPYTLEWNVAVEQALGRQQTVSATYVGSAGKRLIQTAVILAPNPNFAEAQLVANATSSDYNSLQLQFQRRMARGLQVLASYTYAHSIDEGSAGSAYGNFTNVLAQGLSPDANRGPSDFDIRHGFSAGLTYDIPAPSANAVAKDILGGWSTENFILARSAVPVNVQDIAFSEINGAFAAIRPDVVPGQPLYLYGPQYPGHKALNPAAFMSPPTGTSPGIPLRQGDLGRNALRGFGASQWDFAVHRTVPIHDSLKIQFRAELFNVLNHPNFAPPLPYFGFGGFGVSTQMLGQYLSGGFASSASAGALSPLYQIGGPRSIQFALKLMF